MKKRFIFDENYIKKRAKKDTMKWFIIGAAVLVVILIIVLIILAVSKPKKPDTPVEPTKEPQIALKEKIVVDAGDEVPELIDYFTKLENVDFNSIRIEYPLDFEADYDLSSCSEDEIEEINLLDAEDIKDYDCAKRILKTVSSYGVTIYVLDREYTVNLEVVDEDAPELKLKDVEILKGDKYYLNDFIESCLDASGECDIEFYDKDADMEGNVIDYGKYTDPGEYKVKIVARDINGNVTEPVEANLKIVDPVGKVYVVTFNSDGGSKVDNISVEEGSTIKEPSNPTKNGYVFKGWYNGNDKFDFGTAINGNITLVAKWEKVQTQNPGGNNQNPGGSTTTQPVVTSISLNFKKVNIAVGAKKTVIAYVNPSNAVNGNVSWSSSDNSIATVNNGVITGVKAGTAYVTASAGGKSAKVEVVVYSSSGGSGSDTCQYGDTNYNTKYIMSVNLASNGCAVNPNGNYNDNGLTSRDYQSLVNQLTGMGFNITDINMPTYTKTPIRNTSGRGLVGYEITATLKVTDPNNPYNRLTAIYKIKSDGTRVFSQNNIVRNGVKFK